MRDAPWRVVLKRAARALKTIDLAFTRRVQGRPRYRLRGTCNGCGRCCETPSIAVSRFTWFVPTARRVFLWWQRVVNGFVLLERDARFRVFVFRCTHFDPVTKQCDSYASRPLMCRDYPTLLTWEAVPRLFPECSYQVQDRNAAQLTAALEAAGLTGEKLAEVKQKLFLEDRDD